MPPIVAIWLAVGAFASLADTYHMLSTPYLRSALAETFRERPWRLAAIVWMFTMLGPVAWVVLAAMAVGRIAEDERDDEDDEPEEAS